MFECFEYQHDLSVSVDEIFFKQQPGENSAKFKELIFSVYGRLVRGVIGKDRKPNCGLYATVRAPAP